MAGRFPGFASEPVRNGNDLALALVRASPEQRARLVQERTGLIHVFRYLHLAARTNDPARPPAIVLVTREPSSDAWVRLHVAGPFSLRLAADLGEEDAVAAKGRVTAIATNGPLTLTVDPAVLLHKDKPRPKAGRELLNEVDPRAH